MASRFIASLALCGTLALATPSWSADPAGSPSAADKDTARHLMDVGHDSYDRGNYTRALEAYQGADKIMKVTSTGLGVGKALLKLGRMLEARDKLLSVTRIPAAANEPRALADAREEARQLEGDLAERIPSLKVNVTGTPADRKIHLTVDGKPIPEELQKLPRRVDPGKHTIVCKAAGYADVSLEVEVPEGVEHTATIELKPGTSTAPGQAPASQGAGDGPPGNAGRDDGASSGAVSPLVIAGFGVAGAGLIAGSITGGLSLSAASAAKEGCVGLVCPLENQDDADASITLGHISTVSFALAGVGAGLGVVGLVLGGDDSASDAAATSWFIGPTSMGVRGTF